MPRIQQFWVNFTLWAVIIGFVIGGIIFFTPGLQLFNINSNPEEEVAIVVNGQKITRSELEFGYQSLLQQYRQRYQQIGGNFDEQLEGASGAYYQLQLRSQAADALIRTTLLQQEANRRNISIPRTQVDIKFRESYEQFLRANQVTEERLLEFLKDPRIRERFRQFFNLRTGTLSEFKDKLRTEAEKELKQQKLKELVVGQIEPKDQELLDYVERNKQRYFTRILGPFLPTEEELKDYFERHKDEYAKEEVKASHILIRVAPEAPEEERAAAQKRIEQIQRQLQAGADFAELARQYSEDLATKEVGGDLGYFQKGQSRYGEQFDEAAFATDVGGLSGVVRSDVGFHLIKVTDRRIRGFEDVKEQVKGEFINEQEEQRFEAWLKGAREQGTFPQLEEVHARHILIKVAQDAPEEEVQSASRKIAEIRAELLAGADFAELAKKYSEDLANKDQGGDLGWFSHGRMVPEFDQAAFALQEGEISQPVRSQFGFHLIQLLERRRTDDFKNEIRTAYLQEETEKRFEDFVKKTTEAAKIEVREPLLAAYRLEERARATDDTDKKIQLFDEAIALYGGAQPELVTDPYIGYYQSQLYRQKLSQLEEKFKDLGAQAPEQERQVLEQQIEQVRGQAVQSFLKSTYGKRDASAFTQMLEIAPNSAELRFYYARYLIEQQDNEDQAYEQLKKAVEIDPQYWRAQELAADIQVLRGLYASAIEHLKRALELVPAGSREERNLRLKLAKAFFNQGRLFDREENLAEAEKILMQLRQELGETEPPLADVLAVLGDVYMERAEFRQAQTAYRDSLKITNRTAIEIRLGQAYLAAGQLDQAEKTFQNITARDPYAVEARIGLGDVYRAQGQADKALASYRDVLDLVPNTDAKLSVAKKILELDPQDTKTRFRLAQLYLDQGNSKSAIEQYQAILARDPESWQAQRGLGEAYFLLKEYGQAKDHYKSALLLSPPSEQQIPLYEKVLQADQALVGREGPLTDDGKDALLKLAELYLKRGSSAQAKEQLEKLRKDYPDFRMEKVAELMSQLEGSRVKQDELPGEPVEDQGRLHVRPGETHPSYNSKPPTSGWHYDNSAPWGVHKAPIPDELQIHNLEHGGVLVQYRPNAPQELVAQLTSFVERLRQQAKYCKLILAPYPELDKPLALTAWTRILKLESFDEERMLGFIDAWIEKGPEKGIPCR